MDDADIIDALITKLDKLQAVADRLGESSQVIVHWRGERGIAWPKRKAVADLCKELRIKVPPDFLTSPRPRRESAA